MLSRSVFVAAVLSALLLGPSLAFAQTNAPLQVAALLTAGEQPVTIVCLGDSVTGVYYHTGGLRAYPEMLEIALDRIYPQAKVSVINAGISGNTTVDALNRLDADVLAHRPQLVTVMFGLNDMVRVPLADFEANLVTIIQRCRAASAEVMLCTPNSIYDTPSRPVATLEQYVVALRNVAQREGAPLADCYAAYEAVRAKDAVEWALLMSEDIHPNMGGHKLNAEVIARVISGQDTSLDDVGALRPYLPRTFGLLKAGQPVRLLAMPPYDALAGPALLEIAPGAQVEITPWPVEGPSIADIEAAAKMVRDMKPDGVLIAVPATAAADSVEQYIRSYSWILNLSIGFGHREWDCIAITPSVAAPTLDEAQRERETLQRRLIEAQDIGMLDRQPGDDRPADALFTEWLHTEKENENMPASPTEPIVQPCLDYGRSFVNTTSGMNAPLFWVESRCRISDPASGATVEYLQCGSCKSENTFAEKDLFMENNYDFLPVFAPDHCVIFRRRAQFAEGYRDVRPLDTLWGPTVPVLRTLQGRVLTTPEALYEAMDAGTPIIGQTELRDEASGRTAIIEYPVKTLNRKPSEGLWQVDTGPVVLPDLSVPPDQWASTLRLAYIAFRTWDWADFVVEQPTPIMADGQEVAQVYHYSGLVHMTVRNVLIALDQQQ